MKELESQPRLVQISVHAQCVGSAPQKKKKKRLLKGLYSYPVVGLWLSHLDPTLLLIPSKACEVSLSKIWVSWDRKVNLFLWIHVSDTIFKKYIMTTCTSHKIPSWGHANMTLNRRSDLSHWKCSIKSFDGSHQHIQQREKNLGTFQVIDSHDRIEILR